MALVKCPDCGNPVSPKAPACPKCGRPLAARPRRGQGRLFEALGTLILVGGMFACLWDGLTGGVAIGVGFLVFLTGRFLP